MKKTIFFIMSLCALIFLSCQKEENGNDLTTSGYTYTLIGSAGPDTDTKISIADKTSTGVWPVHWLKGDVVNVYQEGVSDRLGSASLQDSYAGMNDGAFTMTTEVSYTGNVIIAHGTDLAYSDGVISATVPAEQERNDVSNSAHIGKCGLAYATAVMNGTTVPVEFSLSHKSALVRLVLKTSEFTEHTLTGATLWCKSASLAGTLSANVSTGEVTMTGTSDYVKASLKEANQKEFGTQAEIWFSVLPVDLTDKDDLYVIVHMTKGISTVTVPVNITGGNLKSGAVNTITISDLKTASAPEWYETVETRYIAAYGKGWSYGPANCFACVYDNEIEFDVKARGNFMECVKPVAMKVLNACEQNVSNKDNLYFATTCAYKESAYITYTLDVTYTVKMTAKKAGNYTGYSSKVLLLGEDEKTIWCFNVWGNAAALKEQTYTNGVMLDRNIGATKHDTDYYRNGSYYQWGRPFQTGWSSSGGLFLSSAATSVTDLSVSAENPQYFYTNTTGTQNWCLGSEADGLNDLWGNENTSGDDMATTSGVKSIYDPCPKGYRVPSPTILNEIMSSAEPLYTTTTDPSITVSGSTYYGASHNWLTYNLGSETAYFHFSGCKWTGGGNCDNNSRDIAALWSNANAKESGRSYVICYRYKADTPWGDPIAYRAAGYPVRCMKDTENR